jgi:galactonate dehydratase
VRGVGEVTLNGVSKTMEAAIHELEHLYIGVSPFDVETIKTIALRMLRGVYSDGEQVRGSAMAAIETACWDVIG